MSARSAGQLGSGYWALARLDKTSRIYLALYIPTLASLPVPSGQLALL